MSSLREKLNALPTKPGVYLFKDRNGVIIYVGKARVLRKRVASYFKPNPDIKTGILLDRLYDIDYITTASELDALILEDELVKKYRPRYNVALKDDKAYPYLKLTVNEEWPRLFLARRKENDGARYFGRRCAGEKPAHILRRRGVPDEEDVVAEEVSIARPDRDRRGVGEWPGVVGIGQAGAERVEAVRPSQVV